MNDRVVFVASLLAAIGIVGGGIIAVLDHAAPIVRTSPQPSAVAAPQTPVVPAAPVVIGPSADPATPSGPAVYRCKVDGAVLYSDAPCKGGRVIEVKHTRGWEAPRYSLRNAPMVVSEAPVQAIVVTPPASASNESVCRLIDQDIAAIDAAARAGGTIPYMEELKERRRKLVDRKYELGC
jgi:hypothetical protein